MPRDLVARIRVVPAIPIAAQMGCQSHRSSPIGRAAEGLAIGANPLRHRGAGIALKALQPSDPLQGGCHSSPAAIGAILWATIGA